MIKGSRAYLCSKRSVKYEKLTSFQYRLNQGCKTRLFNPAQFREIFDLFKDVRRLRSGGGQILLIRILQMPTFFLFCINQGFVLKISTLRQHRYLMY